MTDTDTEWDGWVHLNGSYSSRDLGPLLLEVERFGADRDLWRWRFCIAGNRAGVSNYAHAIERSGPMIYDLVSEAEAKRACYAAALAFGRAIVEAAKEPTDD